MNPMNPCDYSTWNSFAFHPIFGDTRSAINEWSQFPQEYSDLEEYTVFKPEWYVHIDPPFPVAVQESVAGTDIKNLQAAAAKVCALQLSLLYELIILDDFTVYVLFDSPNLRFLVYPLYFDERGKYFVAVEHPEELDDERCFTTADELGTYVMTELAGG